jgi:hypothetical protein
VPGSLDALYEQVPDHLSVAGLGQQAKMSTYSRSGFAGERLTVLDGNYLLELVVSGPKLRADGLQTATAKLAREGLTNVGA